MNLFLREMKSNFKSLIIWSVSFAFLIVVGMIKFAGTSADPALLKDVINQIPAFVRALFGFGDFDISSLIGFYGIVNFYVIVLAAVHACFVAAHTISKEEQEKTTEFLIVKPVSRNKILFSKMMAVLVNVIVINAISSICSILVVSAMDQTKNFTLDIILMMCITFVVQLIFLLIGTTIASLSHKPKLAAARGTMILVATYLLGSLIDMFPEISFLKGLTPFKYFNTVDVLNQTSPDPLMVVLTVVLASLLCILTFKGYEKRDMNI
ncbi:MAG: ABC transporter permease subunit [Clostridia bacterium]